jgi:hypothetical protein
MGALAAASPSRHPPPGLHDLALARASLGRARHLVDHYLDFAHRALGPMMDTGNLSRSSGNGCLAASGAGT